MTLDANLPRTLGHYDLLSVIAHSAGGDVVYRGADRDTGAAVAVHVYGWAADQTAVQRFANAFALLRAVRHPNVVRAIDFGGPPPYMVAELLDGVSVGQRIQQRGAFPERAALGLIAQVCAGLGHVHRCGVVHLSVMPSAVSVTCDGVAKLTEFDLAREPGVAPSGLTDPGRPLGAPVYVAPERFGDAAAAGVRTDVYSLGATLYAMVTGVNPFANTSPLDCWMRKVRNDFPTPIELNPAVSKRVDRAICRAMDADPSRRPGSCREFLEDLTGQAGG